MLGKFLIPVVCRPIWKIVSFCFLHGCFGNYIMNNTCLLYIQISSANLVFDIWFSDDTGKRKSQKVFRVDKCKILFSERSSTCKFESLKLALIIVTCCTILTLAFSPIMSKEHQLRPGSRYRFLASWFATLVEEDPKYLVAALQDSACRCCTDVAADALGSSIHFAVGCRVGPDVERS